MKVADYYRHRLDLFTSGEVHFSSKDELLDFLSLYLKASYASYLSNVYFYAVNIAEQNDASQRKESEPSLVALYVYADLQDYAEIQACTCVQNRHSHQYPTF